MGVYISWLKINSQLLLDLWLPVLPELSDADLVDRSLLLEPLWLFASVFAVCSCVFPRVLEPVEPCFCEVDIVFPHIE